MTLLIDEFVSKNFDRVPDGEEEDLSFLGKWKNVIIKEVGYCGNIQHGFKFVDGKYEFISLNSLPSMEEIMSCSKVISSQLALYRLLCMDDFAVSLEGRQGYKSIWSIAFQHKKSGKYLIFGEWKGSFSFFSDVMNLRSDPDRIFLDDVREFLNVLVSKKLTHPYDRTVVGCQA